MTQSAHTLYTPAEYLALEQTANYKSEYFQGEIFAMAGASINHNRITRNLTIQLYTALVGRPCEIFSGDMRLLVDANGLYTYPDVMVICGGATLTAGSDSTVTNPVVIVEVLSEATSEYDRTDKFELYKPLATLQNYILVDQHRAYIQCFQRKEENSWELKSFRGLDSNLIIPPLAIEIPLVRLYESVEWPDPLFLQHPRTDL